MKQIYIGAAQRSKLFTRIKKTVLVPHLLQLAIFLLLIIVPIALSNRIFPNQNLGMSNVVEIITPYGNTGSAVLISSDKLLTCAHVMEDMELEDICLGVFIDPNCPDKQAIGFKAQLIAMGKYFPNDNKSEDYALLKIIDSDMPIERVTRPCSLGNSEQTKPGDNIQVIGYPLGGYSFTKGNITNITGGYLQNNDFFAVSADAWHGNSGGALLNGAGELIGIVARIGTIQEYNDGLTYVLKLEHIRNALSNKGFEL